MDDSNVDDDRDNIELYSQKNIEPNYGIASIANF